MFYNLITNAVRYNKEQGSITVRDQYKPGQTYMIYISDSGIGIRPEELGTIFNRFKKSGHTEGEGSGLGLSIVKSIVENSGGSIWYETENQHGTTFYVSLPMAALADL